MKNSGDTKVGFFVKNRLCYFLVQDTKIVIVNNDTAKYYIFKPETTLKTILRLVENHNVTQDEINRLSKKDGEAKVNIVLNRLLELKIIFYIDEDYEDYNGLKNNGDRFWTELLFLEKYTKTPKKLFEKLKNKRVVIIGAGALGSSLAFRLSAIGVKNITCIDGDKVELDNLTRQLLYIPEDVKLGRFKVEALKKRITSFYPESSFRGLNLFLNRYEDCEKNIPENTDLIIQTADTPVNKIDDWINTLSLKKRIPVIYSHFGSVGPFVIPGESSCFKCFEEKINFSDSKLYQLTKELVNRVPNSKSPSFVTGSLMNEMIILELIKNQWIYDNKKDMLNKIFTFYDGAFQIKEIEFSSQGNCLCEELKNEK